LIFSIQRRKQSLPLKAEKKEKQNTEHRMQNLEDSKHKSQNHKQIHSVKGVKVLFNGLFDWAYWT
jgi:hypothetical protein